jgi:hypothetical protein
MHSIMEQMLKPMNVAGASILGLLNTAWGFWLALPFFDALSVQTYSAFAVPGFELIWGILALITGVLIVVGFVKKSAQWTVWGALGSFWLWLMFGILILASFWQSSIWIIAFCLALYSGFVYLNMKVNYINLHDKKGSDNIKP